MVASPQSQNRTPSKKTGQSSAKAVSALIAPNTAPEKFLTDLLDTQCRLAKAETGVILRPGKAGQPDILAAYPLPGNNGNGLGWVAKAEKPFRKVMRSGKTAVVRQSGESEDATESRRFLLVVPL